MDNNFMPQVITQDLDADDKPPFELWQIIHTIIGMSIVIFGRFLPAPSILVKSSQRLIDLGFPIVDSGEVLISVSPIGMTIVTIFLGTVYLLATVDVFWPCIFSLLMLGFSDYGNMATVFAHFLGNSNTVSILFLFLFSAALIKSNISIYLARWIITRPILNGRPWFMTSAFLFACFLVAFMEQVSAVFLMYPALYLLFEKAGYKKGDKFVSLMLVNSTIMILLSFASDPSKGGPLYVLSSLHALAKSNPELSVQTINFAFYLFFALCISLISMLLIILSMRFVFKVDVSKLKNISTEEFNVHPLPPLNWHQKGTIVVFILFSLWMLAPGILDSHHAISLFFTENMMAGSAFAVFLLTFINYRSQSLSSIKDFGPKFPWTIYFLIATAIFLGSVMLHQSTHITIFLEYSLKNFLEGMSTPLVIVTICCLGLIMTNFCNSVAFGLLFTPVVITVCNTLQINQAPVVASFCFIAMIAALTPAGSPFAALLFDNKEWLSHRDTFKYALFGSLLVLCVLLCFGMPLATVLF